MGRLIKLKNYDWVTHMSSKNSIFYYLQFDFYNIYSIYCIFVFIILYIKIILYIILIINLHFINLKLF